MKILGICSDVWISSAVLVEDGRVVAAGAEERFTRDKMTRVFPMNAIKFSLQKAGITLEDVDYVALGWNPGIHIKKTNFRFSGSHRWRAQHLYSLPNNLLGLARDKRVDYILQTLKQPSHDLKIAYITHHLAHAANAFYMSPFQESAILTIDGHGEDSTTLFAWGRGSKIEELKSLNMPHSLGLLYGTFTEFLGFSPHADEWKVMALTSPDVSGNPYYPKMKKIITLRPGGNFELDLSYFNYYLHDQLHFYTDKLVKIFGKPRHPDGEITSKHRQIASALQKISEETTFHLLAWLYRETGMKNLAAAGGFFMNSVLNGKIKNKSDFKNIFIPSSADDSGTSIGAALYLYHQILGGRKRHKQIHNYYGPEFSNEEIKKTLAKYKVSGEYVEDIEKYTACLLAEGRLIGWFQGRMEFGQRALGNRSILADPRDPSMKDKVNSAVKYREAFRPFAPSILSERKLDFFECDPGSSSPFMEKVFMIKKDKRKIIPAVTHTDGSGRLQTVEKSVNPRYYRLIKEFDRLTGVPVVLNTSFNLKGEAIVCTPTDALRTFFSCGLDVLIMGNYVVRKDQSGPKTI